MAFSDADKLFDRIHVALKKIQHELEIVKTTPPIQQITVLQKEEYDKRQGVDSSLTTIHFPAGRKRDISQYPNLASPPVTRPQTSQSTKIRKAPIKKTKSSRLASDTLVLSVQKM